MRVFEKPETVVQEMPAEKVDKEQGLASGGSGNKAGGGLVTGGSPGSEKKAEEDLEESLATGNKDTGGSNAGNRNEEYCRHA